MDFLNSKTGRLVLCVCVSGESEGFTGARIGYPRVKKTYCLNASLTGLYKRTSPKKIMQCKLILQFGWLAANPKKLSEALGAKIVIILPRFGSSMSLVCVLFRYPCTIKSPYCQWNEPCQMHIQDYALPPHWVDKTRNNKTLRTLFGTHNKSARKGTYWRSQCHVQWQIPLPQPGLTKIQRLKKIS